MSGGCRPSRSARTRPSVNAVYAWALVNHTEGSSPNICARLASTYPNSSGVRYPSFCDDAASSRYASSSSHPAPRYVAAVSVRISFSRVPGNDSPSRCRYTCITSCASAAPMSRRCVRKRSFSSTKYSGPAASSTLAAWVISRKPTTIRACGSR